MPEESPNIEDFSFREDKSSWEGSNSIAEGAAGSPDTFPGGLSVSDHLNLEVIEDLRRKKRLQQRQDAKDLLLRFHFLQEWGQIQAKETGVGRAFIVELAGMPKAGKSGAIENIRHFFSHGNKALLKIVSETQETEDCKVDTPAEGVSSELQAS